MDQKHRLIVNLADCWFPCKMTGKVDICTFSLELHQVEESAATFLQVGSASVTQTQITVS